MPYLFTQNKRVEPCFFLLNRESEAEILRLGASAATDFAPCLEAFVAMKKYYYTNEQNQKTGPVDYATLKDLHKIGVITSDTAVMAEDADGWTPHKDYRFAESGLSDKSVGGVAAPKKSGIPTWAIVGAASALVGGFLIIVLGVLMLQQLGQQVTGIFNNVQTKLVSEAAHTELNTNSIAKNVLGTDIVVSEVPGNRLNYDVAKRTTTGTLIVKGSKAHGNLNVIREQLKDSKVLKFTKLELIVDGKTYDLLKSAGVQTP